MLPERRGTRLNDLPATGTTIDIVIPAFDAAAFLPRSLPAALAAAEGRRVLVVDAGSRDGTGALAEDLGAEVLRLPRRAGPAEARNAGIAASTADIVLMLDSDCVPHRDVVVRVARAFAEDGDLVAVFGSYDADPPERGFFSLYMNLRHHFTHQRGRREASTFWAGCGAVRRSAFARAGGFDAERFPRPMIEDVELGLRLARLGSLRLDPELRVTHLKRWTLGSVVATDVARRAIPWTELIVESGSVPDDLNLRWNERVAAMLAPLVLLAPLTIPLAWRAGGPGLGLLAAAPVLASVWLQRELLACFAGAGGAVFGVLGWLFHQVHLTYAAATMAVWVPVHGLRRLVGRR